MAKKKTTSSASAEEAEKAILEYMIKVNRPYSATDIFSNLHSKYSKAHVIKALDKLAEEGELLSKLYGKASIYSIKQNIVENNKSEHILDAIDIEINKTTDKMNIIKAENKKFEEELFRLKSEPTAQEAIDLNKQYKEKNKELAEKLEKFKNGAVFIPSEKRERVEAEFNFNRNMWKKRRKMFQNIFDTISDNLPDNSNELKEQLVVEKWPVDKVRPNRDLKQIITTRVEENFRNESTLDITRAQKELFALEKLLNNDFKQKYPLSEKILVPAKSAFKESKPYLHCKIDKLIDNDLLVRVRKEILSSLHFTVKETDIYKVNQTGDLANLDGLPKHELEQLKSLFELRNALYSSDFRNFISQVTDCGPLSGTKMDMSINSYQAGCHLLNHDDVIGTRRVSYILYLTDPEAPWQPKDGGALELYPVIQKGTPATEPTVIIPPQWNQFVMFTVQPGHSFHSVEEVVGAGNRLSISGWFHIPQEGEPGYKEPSKEGEAKSSLEQLQEDEDSSDRFNKYAIQQHQDETLPEDMLTELKEWMNPRYLDKDMISQMSEKFLDESAVQCKEILNDDILKKLEKITKEYDEQDKVASGKDGIAPHGTGVREGWVVQGPPHRSRYMVSTAQEGLFHFLASKFESEAFRLWLKAVTHLVPVGYRGQTRRFRPGHDYTLATVNTLTQGILDVTFCHVNKPDSWEDGDVGGYESYMAGHDGEEDPATYKAADDDGVLLHLPAGKNELSLVFREEGIMRFIKYVSARAPGSRWDFAYEYDLAEEEDNE
ncbi:hypothetical protein G6F45_001183 [Rhizopus arrhizus]|nr:hypothetical protein G6F45_001183 [Rhizopus arrhizus]